MPSTAPRVHRLKWYGYDQNGSGNTYLPPAKLVLIEAPSAGDAEAVMLRRFGIDVWAGMGKYDCECCGERWSPVDEDDGRETVERAALVAGVNLEYPPRDLSAKDVRCPKGAVPGVLRVLWEPARA